MHTDNRLARPIGEQLPSPDPCDVELSDETWPLSNCPLPC
jgi:hypothetical protein